VALSLMSAASRKPSDFILLAWLCVTGLITGLLRRASEVVVHQQSQPLLALQQEYPVASTG
jgi:hypothetical protein